MESSVTLSLADQIEHLVLTGTAAIDATGNAQDNRLTGNAGDNVLDGGSGADTMAGGLGNDTMTGGNGNDFYYVNASLDKVDESASTGIDSVRATVNYTLPTNVEVMYFDARGAQNGTAATPIAAPTASTTPHIGWVA